jgi:hypothetical protein
MPGMHADKLRFRLAQVDLMGYLVEEARLETT